MLCAGEVQQRTEISASPEIFMAVASQRTRHIKLGSGVISVSYHIPQVNRTSYPRHAPLSFLVHEHPRNGGPRNGIDFTVRAVGANDTLGAFVPGFLIHDFSGNMTFTPDAPLVAETTFQVDFLSDPGNQIGFVDAAGNFIERNGLKGGQLYVWKTTNGNTTPQQFNGTGATRTGTWVALNARNIANAGTAGYVRRSISLSEVSGSGIAFLSRAKNSGMTAVFIRAI